MKLSFAGIRLFSLLLALLSLTFGMWGASPVQAVNTAKTSSQATGVTTASQAPVSQMIIKYKASTSAFLQPSLANQMISLSQIAGVSLQYKRAMSGNAHVLTLPQSISYDQAQTVATKLMTSPDVEYAEPDRIMTIAADALPAPAIRPLQLSPNDTQYTNQWDYYETWGINMPAAWNITTGSSSIVVAVIDTGITNHTEFVGRTVSGYDFISITSVANDGGGRDSDPSDPGDWVAANECGSNSAADSSWHGTHTAGTIGAAGNNSTGVAGINWNSKILPVRALGKCGGTTSDIVDAMMWSAGLSVSGVPTNTNPAKVLNLSLGGPGSCGLAFQNAIDSIVSAGAVVVVSAGNSAMDASGFAPSNCNNVITVASTNRSGYMAYYSNYGTTIEISAPGGAQSYLNDPNGILSTLNTGTQGPVADTYIYYQGTSMAGPHIAGVASLMFSLNPSLTPAQILQILQSTAKAFPVGGTCTTSNCGSGIVDAAAALTAAQAIPTATPTATKSATPTVTSTPTRTATRTSTVTQTPTETVTSTTTPTITSTITQTPTITSTVTKTVTLTPTITGTPTTTGTPTATGTATATITQTPTATETYPPTETGTSTITPTITSTLTLTQTLTATITFTPSTTSTITNTPTETEVVTPTATASPTATKTATSTVTITTTSSPTATRTATKTSTSTATRTLTPSPSPTLTATNTVTQTRTPSTVTLTLSSMGALDGWTLETSETSGSGGTLDSRSHTLRLGDDAVKKQYRSILSFNTSIIPDNATVTSVTLKVKKQSITGGSDPFTIFRGLMVDIKNGFFGSANNLQNADFESAGSGSYGPFNPTPANNVYSIKLVNALNKINKLSTNDGLTQIRLRFKLDDNSNSIADTLNLYSGNVTTVADRPQLVIIYSVP